MIRKIACIIEDFPAPVLPTIPIFYPALALNPIFLITRGRSSLYRADKLVNSTEGSFGHY
jgi:hypothetical protein